MKSFPFFLAVLVVLARAAVSGEETPFLAASDSEGLLAREGQRVVVHGEVSGSKKSSSGTNFVNFRNAEFFLVTFKSDLMRFSKGEPTDLYEGKRIAVEGTVSLHQGKPQIKLTDPKQVTLLAPDAVFPPPPESKSGAPAPANDMTEKPEAEKAPAPEAPKPKPPVDPSEFFK